MMIKYYFKKSWDLKSKILTTVYIIIVILIGYSILIEIGYNLLSSFLIGILLLILILPLFFFPLYFLIHDKHFIIKKYGLSSIINLNEIYAIKIIYIEKQICRNTSNGIFGYFGMLNCGTIICSTSSTKNVLISYRNKSVIVSPENVKAFVYILQLHLEKA